MIKSMTGFGHYELTENEKKITVEIKSVNHRYLDVNTRLPKTLNSMDSAIRNEVKKYAARGKIDVYISFEDTVEGKTQLKYNEALAAEYVKYFAKISESFGITNDVTALSLAKCPDVLTIEEKNDDEDMLLKLVLRTVTGACQRFTGSRLSEGTHLKNDLLEKLSEMSDIVDYIAVRSPKVFNEYRERLRQQAAELLGSTLVDESRLATEIVLFADKMCIDEELVRLKSHIDKMSSELKSGDDIGKKLDFLAQEMNREANTIMSKANDLDITNKGIDLKTLIEKIREQIQNIE